MNSILIKRGKNFHLREEKVKNWTEEMLRKHNLKNCQLSIAFVTSKKIRSLNRDYRKLDKATSILSFFQGQAAPGGIQILGDIVICLSEAKKKNLSIKFLIDHGLRNLLSEIPTSKSQRT
jgi:ssRNA-specific RNase YbeY (16S rRNA maturation enzyme)